ncbi:helix-turn-helix transcriptional regulator [Nakamurella endophytica]|uniref:Transcriptional regulator n=1 Tax=Nakamurella endophytica TaxID=1748367 RepID=A0A917T901_9ACTN|nr:WYL domain-containing protein [Nakamurella endophytica]GGM13763.1 transcriptional regulator [Nakamurella endophytica]
MTADASPTSRALMVLELLQGSPGITADRLAERLGVTGRAARRYVAVLREAGIPVESVRGPYGGYRLGRGLRLPPLVFTSTEALGLVMAVLDGHHQAGATTDPVGSALGKIMRALPAAVAAQAEAVRRITAAAPDRAAVRPDPTTTAALVQACADRRRVRLGYRSEAGTEWVTDVDPWAVVVRHGRWYLVCRSCRADAVRAYRVDRVRSVEGVDAVFDVPEDLDAVALLEENLAEGWEFTADVLIQAPTAEVVQRLPRSLGRVQPVDDDTCRLVGTTSNPWWYVEQLAAIPVPFRILGGREIRHAAAAVGERLTAAAGQPAGAPAEPPGDRAAPPHV